jgi:hypothetical protein
VQHLRRGVRGVGCRVPGVGCRGVGGVWVGAWPWQGVAAPRCWVAGR